MPGEFQHNYDLGVPPAKRRRPSERSAARNDADELTSDRPLIQEAALGQFTLLADPATIAGLSDSNMPTARDQRDDELDSLRAALFARSREMEALDQNPFAPTHENRIPRRDGQPQLQQQHQEGMPLAVESDAQSPISVNGPVQAGRLLNSAEAKQLACDAHSREKASRLALANAQKTLQSEISTVHVPKPEGGVRQRGWQQRPLVSNETIASTSAATANTVTQRGGSSTPSKFSDKAERLERAEIRELRATLAVARDSARRQKRDLAELRASAAEQPRRVGRYVPIEEVQALRGEESIESDAFHVPRREQELAQSLEEARSEFSRMTNRLRLNERETEARDAERILLKQTLAERDGEIAERRAQLHDLRDRFDAQDLALDLARRQFEIERTQHSKTREVLAQIRLTLGSVFENGPIVQDEPYLANQFDAASHQDLVAEINPISNSSPAAPVENREDLDATQHESQSRLIQNGASESRAERPTLFDAWQDEQIRRQFGPMGIDTIIDLLRGPLARRVDASRPQQNLVLLGRGASRWVQALVEGLIQNGSPPFMVYVGDPDEFEQSGADSIVADSPIRDFIRPLAFPTSPERLIDAVGLLDPAAIISRDFLSMQDDVTPWLDQLAEISSHGTCLLFSEYAGVGAIDVPLEIRAIGDRIWDLMPERYTRVANASERVMSWGDAFDQSPPSRANNLLPALRQRFRLEMLTQFGFLAEPFLSSSIGSNFDPSAPRDRKFLNQIADLDDRKIEDGSVPALHLVAVVDNEDRSQDETERET